MSRVEASPGKICLLEKGSAAAKAHMAKLRAMRKKKGGCTVGGSVFGRVKNMAKAAANSGVGKKLKAAAINAAVDALGGSLFKKMGKMAKGAANSSIGKAVKNAAQKQAIEAISGLGFRQVLNQIALRVVALTRLLAFPFSQ